MPQNPKESFFLWGPRQVGKSSLLRRLYPNAFWIDLLRNSEFFAYSSRPDYLRSVLLEKKPKLVIIDEVQKVPSLLDDIHSIIEESKIVFGLCGSSARKLKRGQANLLGGRALRNELFGLVSSELGKDFDLLTMLNSGYLPAIYNSENSQRKLEAYCSDYLKEEILNEGLVRRLPPFSRFLELATLSDTEIVSFKSFARDVGVSEPTISSYFDILSDTLIGTYLPAYTLRPKRRIKKTPKFYFFDVGVVNFLAQRGKIQPRSELFGKAFENWVHHELRAYLSYMHRPEKLSYWALSTSTEVDFIIGNMLTAIEVKSSSRIHSEHLKGLRELKVDHPNVKKRFVVCTESTARQTEDGIRILPYMDFCQKLWAGELF